VQASFYELGRPLANVTFVVVDLETTGARTPDSAEIGSRRSPARAPDAKARPMRSATVREGITVATEWTISDAWVFSSIEGTGPDDGCKLTQIIAKADGINHAVLTEAEFTRAVPRLVAAGLIGLQAEADRYWHTEAGQALYRQRMKRRGLFGWFDAIPPALRRLGEPQDSAWSLPAGTFDHAVHEYLRQARNTLKRLAVSRQDPEDTCPRAEGPSR
jgi:hypothetical protein